MATKLAACARLAVACWALVVAAPAAALLPIQTWQTTTGARVYFVESRVLPILDISVDLPAGSAFDAREKSGLAAMTQRMMRLGADGMSEDEIARRIADVGAQLSGRFDNDRAGISLRTLTSPDALKQALEVFARVVQRPEFPETVLEREKTRIVAAIRDADTKPDTIAAKNFYALAYGKHPYGLRSSGEPDTVPALTREDVAAFYKSHYLADQAVVAMIGALSRAEAEKIAEAVTAELPRGEKAPGWPAVPPSDRGETRRIDHPAQQSHVLMGMPAIARSDPDYFAFFVGNYILGGGGFVSRILEEVREKRGLAYSAYSTFSPLKERGPFVIGLQTRREQAEQALDVVRTTLKTFVAKGPTADELRKAKQNLAGGFPLRIDSNRKIHEYLAVIGFYRLPLTYLDDFVANVERVTMADVKAAFARHVDPERMATVVVGGSSPK
jgi:zinc protease